MIAEAGLAQGFEYLTRQHAAMLTNPALWERCAANDNTFPWAAASPFGYNGRYLYTRAEIVLGW